MAGMVASIYDEAGEPARLLMGATLRLVRHASHDEVGRVLSGRSGISLSVRGRSEAEHLGRHLARVPLIAIHTSPRARAQQTAEAIACHHEVAVTVVDALDEVDFGAWTGLGFDALERDPRWQDWNAARGSASTPGGEAMAEATARAVRHVDALDGPGDVLCVSHCDIIRGIVAHYLGLGLDHLLRFEVDPASVTTLALEGGGGARLMALNERAH